jgi:hypothetical protein
MIKSIHEIEFGVGGYTCGSKTYRLNHSGVYLTEEAGYLLSLPPGMIVKKSLNEAQENEVVTVFNDIDFLNWDKEYYIPALDGTQWTLKVTYNGNLKKKVHGSNAYPDGFRKVERLMKSLLR